MMFLVKVTFNTDHNGDPVPDDVAFDDMPHCLFGPDARPFTDLDEAIAWAQSGYPDGDTDVEEIEVVPATGLEPVVNNSETVLS